MLQQQQSVLYGFLPPNCIHLYLKLYSRCASSFRVPVFPHTDLICIRKINGKFKYSGRLILVDMHCMLHLSSFLTKSFFCGYIFRSLNLELNAESLLVFRQWSEAQTTAGVWPRGVNWVMDSQKLGTQQLSQIKARIHLIIVGFVSNPVGIKKVIHIATSQKNPLVP